MAREKHPTLPTPRKPAPAPGTPEHEEWLIDEAEEESFPASDSPSPALPSSLPAVNKTAAKKGAAAPAGQAPRRGKRRT